MADGGAGWPLEPTADPGWRLEENGFVGPREHEIESLFAVGNGFFGIRAAVAEGSQFSAPATFIAGVFDSPSSPHAALVTLPDWPQLAFRIDGAQLRLDEGEVLEHRRRLDLRQGVLFRDWRHRDKSGRITRIRELRFASLANRHLAVQSVTLMPENYGGTVVVEAVLSKSESVRTGSGVELGVAFASVVPAGNGTPTGHAFEVQIGGTYRLDRLLAVFTSQETANPREAADVELRRAMERGLAAIADAHRRAWSERWERADVVVEGDPEAQEALRLAIYHLVSAAAPNDGRASIGARALTGGGYRGHVFWDTETYMLPFYGFTDPDVARSLLLYRYRTLPAARARAARDGHRGARYAWESADTGEDVTPRHVVAPNGEVLTIRLGDEEQHITADVAYAVFNYWRVTGDDRFLLEAGAEIVLETARYWASRFVREEDGRWHLRGVTGPDEYHPSVDDDAYTNVLVQWHLETAAGLAETLAARWPERWSALAAQLALGFDETRSWREIGAGIYTGFDPHTGLFEQFQGYFQLEELPLPPFEARTAPMDLLLGPERVRRSKVIKQPDVVMLLYLLWNRFPPEVREANFRYYEPRTAHGSSLSPSIHALVAARLGDRLLASRYFRQAAAIDLADNMGNAALGVHAAALGGLWQAAVFGFGGVFASADGLHLQMRPRLPESWRRLAFNIVWRGTWKRVELPAETSARAVSEVSP